MGNKLLSHAVDCYKHYLAKVSYASVQGWQTFVKKQLAAGGGKLFAYIAKQDKAFLNVDWRSPGLVNNTPEQFLEGQIVAWSEFGAPMLVGGQEKVAVAPKALREFAKSDPTMFVDLDSFCKALETYNKETHGAISGLGQSS